MGIETLRFRP